jgi:hypothetical protein
MQKLLLLTTLMMLTFSMAAPAKTKGVKEFRANYTQHLDPDPRVEGDWHIGEIEKLKEPFIILYSKNYIRINSTSYFIDKATLKTEDYTEEENPGYAKSTAFAATSLMGESIFVTIEYANRENPKLYGFSIFNRANQGNFYLAELQE